MNTDLFRIGLIGAGHMGGALLRSWCQDGGPCSPASVTVIDPFMEPSLHSWFTQRGGVVNPTGGLGNCDYIVIAVKPQLLFEVIGKCASHLKVGACVASIAAGVTLDAIAAIVGENRALIRIMPNTPAIIGEGASAVYYRSNVTDTQRDQTARLLLACGRIVEVDNEDIFDAVTAVSGSGPAYLFTFVECLTEAARAAGLPEDLASILARQTVVGASALLSHNSEDPSKLREAVCSPGGTTLAGVSALQEDDALCRLLTEAVSRAKKRSVELGREFVDRDWNDISG